MKKTMLGLVLAASTVGAVAATLPVPLLFSVYFDSDYPACCGLVPGHASVTSFNNDEREYGFAEFSLAGSSVSSPLYLSFTLASIDLNAFAPPGQSHYGLGSISVSAYAGNNLAERLDVTPQLSFGQVGMVDVSSASSGTNFVLDVSNAYDEALRANVPALGIRFMGTGQAFTSYNNVATASLTDISISNAIPSAVPEPASTWLMLGGVATLAICIRKKASENHLTGKRFGRQPQRT